jgi:ribA/ribD-fused uncharacterized protein
LYFWGHQPGKDGKITSSCLSQRYPASFEIDGIVYPTAEHCVMAAKARLFDDQATLAKIRDGNDPKTPKALGREMPIKWFLSTIKIFN